VRGVIGPALWGLLRRWGELNGSGWYEIRYGPPAGEASKGCSDIMVIPIFIKQIFN